MFVNCQCQLCIFRTIYDALLKRRVRFTGCHRYRWAAHQFDHLHGSTADHGTYFLSFQNRRICHCLIFFEIIISCTICIITNCNVSFVPCRFKQFLNSFTVCHCIVIVFLIAEQIWQWENRISLIKLSQCIGAYFRHIQYACLYHLYRRRFCSKYTTRINIHFQILGTVFCCQIW